MVVGSITMYNPQLSYFLNTNFSIILFGKLEWGWLSGDTCLVLA